MRNKRNWSSILFSPKVMLVAVIFLLIAGLLFGGAYWYDTTHDEYHGDVQDDIGGYKTFEYNGQTYILNQNVETFLLIGLDSFGTAEQTDSYNNDKQADLLVLFVFDRENEKCQAIQINRDTMTEVQILGVTGQKIGAVNQQIALSHTYGDGGIDSCRNVAVAVSKMMHGLPIDNYASITMDGIKIINDMVGGVTLTVNGDFSGFDDELVDGAEITLLGDHALNYVRYRRDGTNETRMARQRQYMDALCQQSREVADSDDGFISEAVSTLASYTVTNCDVSDVSDFFDKIMTYEFSGVESVAGHAELGEQYVEFKYDPEALKALLTESCFVPQK